MYSRLAQKYNLKKLSKNKLNKITLSFSIPISITLGIIIGLYAIGGFVSRWEITDNTITKYNAFNKVQETCEYDSIESYRVECYRNSVGKYSHGYPTISLCISLKNGKEVRFNEAFIRNGYLGVIALDNALSHLPKEIKNDSLGSYIDYHSLSDEEKRMLREVFDEK